MSEDAGSKVEQARSALERAHRAAMGMESGELRRAMEEARDLLVGENDAAAARLGQAITMLEAGPLDRMELLIEEVRASL